MMVFVVRAVRGVTFPERFREPRTAAAAVTGKNRSFSMKPVSLLRIALAFLLATTIVGISNPLSGEEKAAPKSDVVWKQIGETPGVVGMAAAGGNLFAITSDRKLQVCDPAASPLVWKEIGDAPGGVVAMGVADGKLFASTNVRSAGRLLTRGAVATEAAWEDVGHAWCLIGMAGAPGKIYALVDTKSPGSEVAIMTRDTVGTPEAIAKANAVAAPGCDGLPWNATDRRPPLGAVAITSLGGKFYAANKEDMFFVGDPTKADVPWKAIGDAAGVTILAGGDGKLFAATKTGKLLMWAPKISK
jgi:hypothetical protein